MELRSEITEMPDGLRVGLAGEADLATLPILQSAMTEALTRAGGRRILVDLDELLAVDDAALGVLLGAAGRARVAGGDLAVLCTDPARRDRLAVTGFARAVELVEGRHTITS
jgi:anti-anti-sigma factor